MKVATFYFPGTSHGLKYKDDTLGDAFLGTSNRKAYFAGPGGKPPTTYVNWQIANDVDKLYAIENSEIKNNSASNYTDASEYYGIYQMKKDKWKTEIYRGEKLEAIGSNILGSDHWTKSTRANRQIRGKGWNRNAWFAIQLIYTLLKTTKPGKLRLNMVGHSRGSITIIMLLNDIFAYIEESHDDEYLRDKLAARRDNMFSTVKRSRKPKGGKYIVGDFDSAKKHWEKLQLTHRYTLTNRTEYDNFLKMVYHYRISEKYNPEGAIELLKYIRKNIKKIEFNIYLNDPCAGVKQGVATRKLFIPEHESIKHIRLIRMMQDYNLTLNDALPPIRKDGNWKLCDAHSSPINILSSDMRELPRYLEIPMVGSHGAAVGGNGGDSIHERDVGGDLLLRFLLSLGTKFEKAKWMLQHECPNERIPLKKLGYLPAMTLRNELVSLYIYDYLREYYKEVTTNSWKNRNKALKINFRKKKLKKFGMNTSIEEYINGYHKYLHSKYRSGQIAAIKNA
ncbi:MAG: hypothetical protein JJV89_01105 [Desulfosarcina sp.]|nr:hypothetical protein [Desulfobacterales bacterium]